MATTKDMIRRWLTEKTTSEIDEYPNLPITHMLVVWDTFDYEDGDYPVYVSEKEDINKVIEKFSQNMQRIMEVYSYKRDIEEQLRERRSWHPDNKDYIDYQI